MNALCPNDFHCDSGDAMMEFDRFTYFVYSRIYWNRRQYVHVVHGILFHNYKFDESKTIKCMFVQNRLRLKSFVRTTQIGRERFLIAIWIERIQRKWNKTKKNIKSKTEMNWTASREIECRVLKIRMKPAARLRARIRNYIFFLYGFDHSQVRSHTRMHTKFKCCIA